MSTASCNSNSNSNSNSNRNDNDSSTKPSNCACITRSGRIFRKSNIGKLKVDVDDGSENARSRKFFGKEIRDPDQQPAKRNRVTPNKDSDDSGSDPDLDQQPSKRKRVTLDEDSDDSINDDDNDGDDDDAKPKRILRSAGNGKKVGKFKKKSLKHNMLLRSKNSNRISAKSNKSPSVTTVATGLERRSSASPLNDVFPPAEAELYQRARLSKERLEQAQRYKAEDVRVPVPAKVVVVSLDSYEELKKRCRELEKANGEFYKHINQAVLKVLQKKFLAQQLKNHAKCFRERLAAKEGENKNEQRKAIVAVATHTGSYNKKLHKQMANAKATWNFLLKNNDHIQEELVGVRIRNRTLAYQYCRAQAELAEAKTKPRDKGF